MVVDLVRSFRYVYAEKCWKTYGYEIHVIHKILHLSHTDIKSDSRILKELRSLEQEGNLELTAIGVAMNEGAAAGREGLKARISSIRLWSRALAFLPRPIRYAINMVELTIRFVARGLAIRPDIVHCHDTLALPSGAVIKMLTGCRLIYDAHELESDKNGQGALLSKGTLFVERVLWGKIDLLISVSEAINAWYTQNLGEKRNILILNAPEISPLSASVAECHNKYFHSLYGIPVEKKIFIYIGILGAGRGIELCLRVFAEEDIDAHVVFMGYGPLRNEIESSQRKHNNIHLHDPVPHELVVSMARNADVGLCFIENVSLSDYYSLPNKLFEYAFSGLPVLASDFPEIQRIVEKFGLGVCSPVEQSAIRGAIVGIVSEPLSFHATDLSELSWETQGLRLREEYLWQLSSSTR